LKSVVFYEKSEVYQGIFLTESGDFSFKLKKQRTVSFS
jgi:hypothetical protein